MSLVTSAMSLLERIFFWRPDALPLLGGIKASKHTTASSSSLLPFVHVRQCVTSDDSKNKQKMCFVAGGGGSPVGWNLSPTIPSLLSPTPPKEGCCCWRSSLNSPTYSPRSSSSPLTLPLLPIQAVATSSVITQAPHIQFPGHHDAHLCIVPPPRCPAQPQRLPSPHIQSARHLLHLTPTMPPMMMHVFLLQLLPTNTKYNVQSAHQR